jgi:AcrR family transcriptional regulator
VARPKSEDKRNAIMEAAIRVIGAQGLGAPTMKIAEEAGVANGSLFTYFETKSDLLNQLYLELKAEMTDAALEGFPADADLREQLFHAWSHWMDWAVSQPQKRRVLAQLGVADEVTPATRAAAQRSVIGLAELMQRLHANGPMRNAPIAFVAALMNAFAETTMDFIINDPANAKKHGKAGFDALWRAVG